MPSGCMVPSHNNEENTMNIKQYRSQLLKNVYECHDVIFAQSFEAMAKRLKQRVNGVKYVKFRDGIYCAESHVQSLKTWIKAINKEVVRKDMATHNNYCIISRVLMSNRCCSVNNVFDALKEYPISEQEIRNVVSG